MEKMNIKVDAVSAGNYEGDYTPGNPLTLADAQCTVELMGETVSVQVYVTDCDGMDFSGSIIEFESGDCYGTIENRPNSKEDGCDWTHELYVNDEPKSPAIKEICENSDDFVDEVLGAVEKESIKDPIMRWGYLRCVREYYYVPLDCVVENLVFGEENPVECDFSFDDALTYHAELYVLENCRGEFNAIDAKVTCSGEVIPRADEGGLIDDIMDEINEQLKREKAEKQ